MTTTYTKRRGSMERFHLVSACNASTSPKPKGKARVLADGQLSKILKQINDATPIEVALVKNVNDDSASCAQIAGEQGEPEGGSTSDFSSATSHICRGYHPNTPHFDGLAEACNEDYLIDLDTDSMERLPDIRAYFFYIGYDTVHELRANERMDPLEREQENVRAGRLALRAEKEAGRGLFLTPRDWVSFRIDGDPWPWYDTALDIADGLPGDAEAKGHSGVWDSASSRYEWTMPLGLYAATNKRAPLFPKKDMLIGPEHPDWTKLIVGLYVDHPLGYMNMRPIERQDTIMTQSIHQGRWYTPESIHYYEHYGSDYPHDSLDCSYREAEYRRQCS